MHKLAPLAYVLTGCGPAVDEKRQVEQGEEPEAAAPMQTVEANEVTRDYLLLIEGYPQWPMFPENPTPKFSQGHANMYVVAHHNTVVGEAIETGTLPLPEGAIIVKDNFATPDDTTPMAITVMAKQADGWYWIEATPDGAVIVDQVADPGAPLQGTDVELCVGCHGARAANDFIYTHDFGAPAP